MVATVGLTVLPLTAAAQGTCSFSVSASPESVAEGGTVAVTVRRGGPSNPSSIDVETTDESANAPNDYDPITKQTVHFTSASSKEFSIAVKEDAVAEPQESFRIELSNPQCGDLTVFSVGPDAVVRIQRSDAAAPDSPQSQESSQPSSQAVSTNPTSPTPTPTVDSEESLLPTTPTARAPTADRSLKAEARGRAFSAWALLVIIVIALSIGVGIWYFRRRLPRS